jgi:5-deoxy-D-glucuronate isomerase
MGLRDRQLADKAARTVVLLTEGLDHHRGRGQQQITVKHVTTNNVTADQAIVAESVTTGGGNVTSPALLAASSEIPMPILSETRMPDPVGVG